MCERNGKKLFILVTQLELAGAQRVAIEQARYFWNRGYYVALCFLYDKQGLIRDLIACEPYPVMNLDMKRSLPSFIRGWFVLLSTLRRNRYDLIHTHTHYANIIGAITGWIAGVPARIATKHSSLSRFPRWFWRLYGFAINLFTTYLIAVSNETRRFCIEQMKVRSRKMITVYNGVNVQDYDARNITLSVRNDFRKGLGLSNTDSVVLTVARLAPEKGHRYLIEAAVQVLKQKPDVHFLFVGEGPLRSTLEEQVRAINLQERIHFLGLRRDIAKFLSITNLFVLPAINNEAMPLSVLEAMASGVPVISTDVGGIREVIENGSSGLVVPPANSEALARAILRLLNDPALSKTMGEYARQRVATMFSWERTFAQYEALYQKALA